MTLMMKSVPLHSFPAALVDQEAMSDMFQTRTHSYRPKRTPSTLDPVSNPPTAPRKAFGRKFHDAAVQLDKVSEGRKNTDLFSGSSRRIDAACQVYRSRDPKLAQALTYYSMPELKPFWALGEHAPHI